MAFSRLRYEAQKEREKKEEKQLGNQGTKGRVETPAPTQKTTTQTTTSQKTTEQKTNTKTTSRLRQEAQKEREKRGEERASYTRRVEVPKNATPTELITGRDPRDATLWDLTINSLKQGYYNSIYGQESYKAMTGQDNEKAHYESLLMGKDYQFETDKWWEDAISGAANLLGQQARQWTDPRSLAAGTAAAGVVAVAGQAGPQIATPEEIITVPGAFIAGMQAGSTAANYEIEAGLAYNEMIENGISEETAKNIALAVGGVNAALEMVQLDELGKAFKVLDNSNATKGVTKRLVDELKDRGIDVAKETAQEVMQEGSTILGTQAASKLDKGEWAYNSDEVMDRLGDTALSSALSFGVMNAPAAGMNMASTYNTNKQLGNIGNEYQVAAEDVINEGLTFEENSEAYQTATVLKSKMDAGETVTDAELGKQVAANQQAIRNEERIAEANKDPVDSLVELARETVEEQRKIDLSEDMGQESGTQKASVPYNVMSTENPVRQKALIDKQALTKKLGYGEEGVRLFEEIEAANDIDRDELIARFDTPYQAGLTGLPMEKANLVNSFQTEVYNAGRLDQIARMAKDKQAKPSVIHSEAESGFDFSKAPSDLSQEYKDFGNFMAKAFGVKGEFNGYDGVDYNAKYNKSTGVVAFAQDFGIDPKLMKKLGSMDYQQKVENLAAERGNSYVFYIAHEIADHVAANRAPEAMRAFNNAMYNYKQSKAGYGNLARETQAFYRDHNVDLTTEGAIEEVSADSILMLYDGDENLFMEAMRNVFNGNDTQAKEGAKIYKNKLDEIIQKLKAWLRKLTGKENAEARSNVEQGITELEQLRNMFEKAMGEAMTNVRKARAAQQDVATVREGLGAGTVIQTNKNGELLLAKSKDGSKVVFSLKTYNDGGKDKLREALLRNGHTRTEIDDTLAMIDDAADYLTILAAGFAKTHGYTALSDHLVADIVTNLKTGKQVMSALVNNGDYPVNIDLALICKKRIAYMNLMTRLIEDGIFDLVNYKGEAIADVNDILRANGFETACLGCFVESRRLQFQAWAETIVSEWNAEVDKRKKNAKNFGFSNGRVKLSDTEMDFLAEELKKAGKKNKQGNLNLGQGSAKVRIGRLLDMVPSLQQHLTVADLLTPSGLAALREYDSNIFSIVKSRYGAASPKIVQDFNPYASEIAMMTFKSVSEITSNAVKGAQEYIKQTKKDMGGIKKQPGETDAAFRKRRAEHNANVENEAMRRYLYDIGGARIQSFSDFMIENVFDYLQITADLAANKFPLHGYTKETICLRLLGMTGAKWNGSLIAHTERSMGKEYAGLLPAEAAKDGSAILVHTEDGDYAIGFDDYARNKATDGQSFIQSIGMKDIIAVQLDPRYSKNVGSITIGVSDKQILAMLDSPLFSMVIPYHASGMIPGFAKRVGVDMYNDYTDYQNTSVRQLYDANGNAVDSLVDSKGDKVKIDTSFAFNAEIQKTGDARTAANNYIKWCAERHPVYDGKTLVGYATFSPKFSDSPYGTDFSRHPNYYKLLEDFNTYDCITGESAVQGPVTMTFPSESNRLTAAEMEAYKQRLRDTGIFSEKEIAKYEAIANKTFKELIEDEIKGRADYKVRQDAKWEKTVKEIKDKLLSDHARTAESIENSGEQAYTDVSNFQFLKKGDSDNDQNRIGGVRRSGGEEGSHTGGGKAVRGTLGQVPGKLRIPARGGVSASFGAIPSSAWAKRGVMEPADGSVAQAEQQVAMEYGVPSFVVSDKVWEAHSKKAPAFSRGGQIYFRETMPESIRGKSAMHELTHVMKQVGFKPYLDFIKRTPGMMNLHSAAAQRMLNQTAKHRGIDLKTMNDESRIKLYDELNATVYGYVAVGEMRASFYEAFRDFDSYSRELTELHQQFKESRTGEQYSLKGYTEDGTEVYETSDEVLKLPWSERKKLFRNLVSNDYRGRTARFFNERTGEFDYAVFTDDDIGKAIYGNNKSDPAGRDAFVNTGADGGVFDLVENAKYDNSEREKGKKTKPHKNVVMWDYYVKTVQIDGAVFDMVINVRQTLSGEFVYSVQLNENENKAPAPILVRAYNHQGEMAERENGSRTDATATTMPQNGTGVKEQLSLKGEQEMRREIERVRQEGRRVGKSKIEIESDVMAVVGPEYGKLLKTYGEIKRGERPARDISVPRMSEEGRKVSQTVRTILEAEVTPDSAVPTIQEMITTGEFSYEVYSDKAARAAAEATIRNKGYQTALADWLADVREGKVNKTNTALGWELYNQAATSGDLKTAMTVLNGMVQHQRSAAQALQATRILKKMEPDAQLYGIQRSVENLQEELAAKYGKKAPDLKVDEELAKKFLEAKTDKERAEAEADIYRDIGKQMPSNFVDKWNAWRYLAMLGNVRTHVRNVVGNAGFAPVVMTKNLAATAIEGFVDFVAPGKISRTKGGVNGELLKAAWADYANADDATAGGKYNDAAIKNKYIDDSRSIFKFKPLEKARKFNSAMLSKEDMWFAQPHYAFALAQYCKVNNISAEQLRSGNGLNAAREYAIREAKKATYQDMNMFSEAVGAMGRYHGDNKVKKAASVVMEGVMPFRKTPANILVRGLEYSPMGLLKSLFFDLARVKKGDMTAAQAIDNIAAGATGSALLGLGLWLAAEGLIRGGGGGEEEEKKYAELQGHQAYALELPNGTSITLDWLAPEVLPLFVGVNLYEMAKEKGDKSKLSDIFSAIATVTEPMLEMSCLQSLNDVFDSVGYASSNELPAIAAALASAATSYLTQALPTLLGQAERSAQDVRMTTYTEKNGFLTSDMQYTLGRASSRLPGWDYQQIPYIDAWGREESTGGRGKNIANNFLNPAYTSQIESSAMEEELQRLYDATGEGSVLPSRAPKYFTVDKERKDLTAEEYVEYATEKGQMSYDMLTELTSGSEYAEMGDAEKAKAVSLVYEYANAIAKTTMSDYEPTGWVAKALEAEQTTGMDEMEYIMYKMALEMAAGTNETEQKANAISSMSSLSDDEIAFLWDTKSASEAYDAGIDMRTYVEHAAAGDSINVEKLAGAKGVGVSEETYFDFREMLKEYDQPTKSGKMGSFTQDEAAAAISAMPGLTREQRAYLWQSVNKGWSAKNNPWR